MEGKLEGDDLIVFVFLKGDPVRETDGLRSIYGLASGICTTRLALVMKFGVGFRFLA